VLLSAVPTLPVFALDGGVSADDARVQSEAMGVEAAGGLKAGTGRPLNALIKMRAETGVERTGAVETPLFKAGQCFDELKTARGSAEVAFSFPEAWTMATGPNLDVRDVKTSDSSFVLVAPLPDKRTFESLKDAWFMEVPLSANPSPDPSPDPSPKPNPFNPNPDPNKVIFNPLGKYGSYGAVEERKVVSSKLVPVRLPSGGEQAYRRMSLKFAPLTYNMKHRRATGSCLGHGGGRHRLHTGVWLAGDALQDDAARARGGAGLLPRPGGGRPAHCQRVRRSHPSVHELQRVTAAAARVAARRGGRCLCGGRTRCSWSCRWRTESHFAEFGEGVFVVAKVAFIV